MKPNTITGDCLSAMKERPDNEVLWLNCHNGKYWLSSVSHFTDSVRYVGRSIAEKQLAEARQNYGLLEQ